MAQEYTIKLEVDQESLSKVKTELDTLYAMADKAAQRIETAVKMALSLWAYPPEFGFGGNSPEAPAGEPNRWEAL